MLIYIFPIPLRRGSNLSPWIESSVHVEEREVLTAIGESGGLLPLLRSAAAGESWESGEEWGEGAVRGGEANNCRCFGKQCGFSSVAARVQPPPPTCTARAWLWRSCRFERSQGARPRSALNIVPCRPNSVCSQPNRSFSSRADLVGPHAGNQTHPT